MNNIVWQLPVGTGEYISKKTKYHCFANNESLCGKYAQQTDLYDSGITMKEGEVAARHKHVCKKCYKKWKEEIYSWEG